MRYLLEVYIAFDTTQQGQENCWDASLRLSCRTGALTPGGRHFVR